MTKITTEIILAVAIIVLTILAIVVFISSGSGFLFYGLFVVALIAMLFMWYRLSYIETQSAAAAQTSAAKKKTTTKRRRQKA